MNDYDFTLKFVLSDPECEPDTLIERLASCGCDDALVGVGQCGRIALTFTRAAHSAYEAVCSALADVKRAIPDASLVEASPDFVGLSDAAELLGFSRQNMRKLMLTAGAKFPAPVHEGPTGIWQLADLLRWFTNRGTYSVNNKLVELAEVNRQVNLARQAKIADWVKQQELSRLVE